MTKHAKPDLEADPSEIGTAMAALNIDTDVHPLYAERAAPGGARAPTTPDDPFRFQSRTVPPGLVNAAPPPQPASAIPHPTVTAPLAARRHPVSTRFVRRAIRAAFVAALFLASVLVVLMALAAAGHSDHQPGIASNASSASDASSASHAASAPAATEANPPVSTVTAPASATGSTLAATASRAPSTALSSARATSNRAASNRAASNRAASNRAASNRATLTQNQQTRATQASPRPEPAIEPLTAPDAIEPNRRLW
jgi:hypothetical protein